MTVEVSEATPADAEELSALAIKTYVETFGAEFESDELAHHLEQTIATPRWVDHLATDRVFMARVDTEPVGFVQFGPTDEAVGAIQIHRLYVDARFQGRGIGSDLLRRALAEPEVATAPMIIIDVWERNFGAQRLYERFGFRDEGGREPFVLSTGQIDGYDFKLVRRWQPQA
jgi:ribosomal protein S18 acetylase RimI-like enzyme